MFDEKQVYNKNLTVKNNELCFINYKDSCTHSLLLDLMNY